MPVRTTVKYQGYQGRAVSYRRSDGLDPEPGWIDLTLRDLGRLEIFAPNVPWKPVNNGGEMEGGLSIQAWSKIITPTAEFPSGATPRQAALGLDLFGDLSLQSFENGQAISAELIYRNIYVDSSGIEEIGDQIKAVKAHDRGFVRVPLTDVRRYYRDYSPFVGRINVKLKSGEFDQTSMKFEGGTWRLWKLSEVLQFLFSQLPGTPAIRSGSDGVGGALADQEPYDIVGEGEPVREIIDNLLQKYGLVPKMQPEGNFVLRHKNSMTDSPSQGKIFSSPGNEATYPKQHYETKGVWVTDRPPAVVVIGPPVIRRITIPYIPVIQDTDGLYYPLGFIDQLWGYSLAKLNAQVFNNEKQFNDVPGVNLEQKAHRIRILSQQAYKCYAPATAFIDAGDGPEGIPAISAARLAREPFLPLVEDVPFFKEEFQNIAGDISFDNAVSEQNLAFLVTKPIIRAKRFGEGIFKDFGAIEDHFNGLLASLRSTAAVFARSQGVYEDLRSQYGRKLLQTEKSMQQTLSSPGRSTTENAAQIAGKWLFNFIAGVPIDKPKYNLPLDVLIALREMKLVTEHDVVLQTMTEESTETIVSIARMTAAIEGSRQSSEGNAAIAIAQEAELEKLRTTYKDMKGILLRMNLPWGLLPSGMATLDTKTGIVLSSVPLCHAKKPYALSGDKVEVIHDGSVIVTAAYERRDNGIQSVSSVIVTVDEQGGGTREVAVAGANRTSPIKAKIVRAPTMRLYETDLGTPFNSQEVAAMAKQKAEAALDVPKTITGYTYIFSGLVEAVLDGGVNSIQHVWDGNPGADAIAHTHVTVNMPGARAPLGPVLAPREPAKAVVREALAMVDPLYQGD